MTKIILLVAFFSVCLLLPGHSNGQAGEIYSLEKKIMLPGDDGYDYLFADQENRRLYVSHGTSVHVLDLDTEMPLGMITGMQGVHGITVVPKSGLGFITDGKANAILVFDTKTQKIVKSILLGGTKPDAITFDPFSNQVMAFNSGSNNVSVIDVPSLKEKSLMALGGAPEFAVSDGAGRVYNNLEDKNQLVVIDVKKMKIVDSINYAPNGAPTSLFYDAKNKRIFSGCRQGNIMAVIDAVSRKIIANIPICKGVDAIVFDENTRLIFCSGDGTTSVIKQVNADKYELVQTLTTGTRAKTMALDKKTHKIYISVADYEPGTRKIIPGTFRLLLYKML